MVVRVLLEFYILRIRCFDRLPAVARPPTSREERLRDEHSKEKKDRVVRAKASF